MDRTMTRVALDGRVLAEGRGVEPPALLRCRRPGVRSRLPSTQRDLPFVHLAEGVGIEPTRPLRTGYDLASRRIAALPTFRTTRKIDLMSGAAGVESNPQPPAYKAGALPIELQRREAFGFVWASLSAGLYTGGAVRDASCTPGFKTPKWVDADSRRKIGNPSDGAESETQRLYAGLQRASRARSSTRQVSNPVASHQ